MTLPLFIYFLGMKLWYVKQVGIQSQGQRGGPARRCGLATVRRAAGAAAAHLFPCLSSAPAFPESESHAAGSGRVCSAPQRCVPASGPAARHTQAHCALDRCSRVQGGAHCLSKSLQLRVDGRRRPGACAPAAATQQPLITSATQSMSTLTNYLHRLQTGRIGSPAAAATARASQASRTGWRMCGSSYRRPRCAAGCWHPLASAPVLLSCAWPVAQLYIHGSLKMPRCILPVLACIR